LASSGFWLLASGFWLLAVGFWLLAFQIPHPQQASQQPATTQPCPSKPQPPKVLESRPPPGPTPIGGACRLRPNALTAAAAISPDLLDSILDNSAHAQQVLLHDTEANTVITRLQPLLPAGRRRGGGAAAAAGGGAVPGSAVAGGAAGSAPAADARRLPGGYRGGDASGRAAAAAPGAWELVIGWAELERLFLEQLPPGTVEWASAVTEMKEDAGRMRLQLGGGQQGVVSAEVLVDCSGALSAVSAACCTEEERAEFQVCGGGV